VAREVALELALGADKRVFNLVPGAPVTIGRQKDLPFPIDARLLSRRHCEIALGESGPELRDLTSANGTYLNGLRVSRAHLSPGDLIRVGDVTIRVDFREKEGADWLAAAAGGEMRCQSCGGLITTTTVHDAHRFEWGSAVICATCRDGAVRPKKGHIEALLRAEGLEVIERLSPDADIAPVLKVRRTGLGDLVAVKVLPLGPELPPTRVERFRAEARSMAAIKHPNVVPVYDVRERPDILWFVMELVEGESLLQRIERQGKVALDETLGIGAAIARALAAAARQGITHRNVKPANVVISREGTPKLVDFGLAKGLRIATDLTGTGITLGTVRYMAPEQVKDPRTADTRSDLYSLATTLFQALSGLLPYPDSSEVDILFKVARGKLPTFDPTGTEGIPDAVAAVLARAMKRDPVERFATGDDMALALEGCLAPGRVDAPTRLVVPALVEPGVVTGAFEGDGLVEQVQMLGVNEKTGTLTVTSQGAVGRLVFGDGKVVGANLGERVGADAAYAIVALARGEFAFRPGVGEGDDLDLSVQALLMEALRRRDEAAGKG
jgi:hypothetical protein